jgi:hypothetical protein
MRKPDLVLSDVVLRSRQQNINRKIPLYAIARVQRPSESPAALAEDYVPSEA